MRNGCQGLGLAGAVGLTILASCGILSAQESPTPQVPRSQKAASIIASPAVRSGVEARLAQLDQQLSLTAEQKAKILPLLKHETERIREVRGNSSLSAGEVRRRTRAIRRETDQRIVDFLTPQQKKQWQDQRPQQQAAT